MTRIQYLREKSVEVAACSQTFDLPFLADTKLQSYRFAIDYGNEEVTNNTSLFLVAEYSDREEYKYKYAIYYQLPKNSNTNLKVTNWLLTLYFEDTTIDVDGVITQRILPNASSISNFSVFDSNGNLLPKDYVNRWIISSEYVAGSRFTIRYDASYPANPSLLVNTKPGDAFGDGFIDKAWTEGVGTSVFEINGNFGSYNQNIIFDFTDNWGIGDALTYITFTRDNIRPVKIRITPDKLVNVAHEGGNFNFEVTYENIEKSQLKIENDVDWLDASWNGENMTVSIQPNEGIDSVQRGASIKISGTNNDGIYGEGLVYINQIAMDIPYIGDAVETTKLLDGTIIPAIHTDYKGNVINNTGVFTLFNTKDADGDNIVKNTEITIDDKPTDFLRIEDVPDTRNSKIIAKNVYKYNYQSETVVKYIDIKATLISGQSINYIIGIVIDASPEHIVSPIWKDVYYESPKNYFRFKELNTGDLLYNGVIYPDANNNIKINNILNSYIDLNKCPFEKDINKNKCMIEAILEISDTPSFEHYDEARIYHLYWNYSYDYSAPHDLMSGFTTGYEGIHSGIDVDTNFANPIEYYDPRQYIFISYSKSFYETNETNSYVYGVKDNGDREEIIKIYKDTIKGDIATMAVRPMDYDEIIFHTNAKSGEDWDKFYEWKVGHSKCTKADYAVYYLNSYGIWCWMLFEGKQVESLKVTPNEYFHHSDNSISYNIHNAIYSNGIEEYYELTSSYIKDDQSEKLKDLFTSPLIYVHELNNDIIYNVVLDTKAYTKKTFINQGRKYYTYNIKLVKSINKNIIV